VHPGDPEGLGYLGYLAAQENPARQQDQLDLKVPDYLDYQPVQGDLERPELLYTLIVQ
jgi:hypothetical protein